MKITALQIGSFSGLVAVALGALGAHYISLENRFDIKISDAWETAALYQLFHALALILVHLAYPHKKWANRMFCLGTVLFSGSIVRTVLYKLYAYDAKTKKIPRATRNKAIDFVYPHTLLVLLILMFSLIALLRGS